MLIAKVNAQAPNNQRARLYREHKYVLFVLSDLIQFIGSLDFSQNHAVAQAKDRLLQLRHLLESHAQYEESRIHAILKNNNSILHKTAELQHESHSQFFEKAEQCLTDIENANHLADKNYLGYQFYLDLRQFFAQNLTHFDYEERVILPELQRLASDEEILEIDAQSYRLMEPEQLTQMMEILFPHMNCDDRLTFLRDIKVCQADKFEAAWQGICSNIEEDERTLLKKSLNF